MRLVIPSSARTERLLSQFLVVLSRLMGILAKRLPRLLRLGAGHKNTPGIPRAGAASRQRSCTYAVMSCVLCQLSYSDVDPHLFSLRRWRRGCRPLVMGYPASLSVVSQLLSVCNPSGFHGWARPSWSTWRVSNPLSRLGRPVYWPLYDTCIKSRLTGHIFCAAWFLT